MCRYAITYKPHFACFKCRKSFKRRLLKDISDDDKQKSVPAKCPECGELMADMGLDFKAPSKTNIKAWEHLTNLYSWHYISFMRMFWSRIYTQRHGKFNIIP